MKTTIHQTLTFGREGNAEPALLHGWSGREDGFNWTLGAESSIVLQRPDAPHGFFVELTAYPLIRLPTPSSQRLLLWLDGDLIARVSLDHGGAFAFFVAGPSQPGLDMTLVLGHPDALPPEAGRRDVAFAVRTVRIMSLDAPWAPIRHRDSCLPLNIQEGDTQVGADDPIAAIERASGRSARDLVVSFETIAGNCEFGSLQRLCGMEPLNLLRFAGATAVASITGLDIDFAGIGQDIEPRVAQNNIREWMIHDRVYNLNYHSMISSDDISAEEIKIKESRKVRFLLRKFLEDLAEGSKTYVCSDSFAVTLPEAMALFLALRRKSTAWLLWVQVAARPEQAGNVYQIAPGLMCGYVDRLAPRHDGTKISLRGWLAMLRNAARLQQLEHAHDALPTTT